MNWKLSNDGVSASRTIDGWTQYKSVDELSEVELADALPADPEPITPYTVLREAAYKLEADPLFFQEQRGEVPVGTWAAKVAEIKVRYPKT